MPGFRMIEEHLSSSAMRAAATESKEMLRLPADWVRPMARTRAAAHPLIPSPSG
jgi:hypothetical protein